MKSETVQKPVARSAGAGVAAWLFLLFLLPSEGLIGAVERIVLLAVLVLAPLQLLLVDAPNRRGRRSRFFCAALLLQPWAALLASAAFLIPQGPLSAMLCAPWLVFTASLFVYGLRRLLSRGLRPLSELAIDAGLLYVWVGAVWMIAHRTPYPLLGFDATIVALTSVHFHFAGFAAPLIVGVIGRLLEPRATRIYRLSAALVIAGIPLTAAGIYVSPLTEVVAACAIAVGLALFAALCLVIAIPQLVQAGRFAAAGLLLAACLSVCLSMFYAARYALGEFAGIAPVSIPDMIVLHGWWNALGFAGAGLLAAWLARPASLARPDGIPFSRLASSGRLGRDFFERNHLVNLKVLNQSDKRPRGLTDNLEDYARPDFPVHALHPKIRAFYERTEDFELLVRPRWRTGFFWMAKLYKRWFSSRLEQMNFPLRDDRKEDRIGSKILPLRSELDGREGVRAWVRWYHATDQTVYVAAYANHRCGGRTFMNIHFPLPGGGLTSILRLESLPAPDQGGLLLTSLPDPRGGGDEGVYFVNRWIPLRLPINESIYVYKRGMPGAEGIACEGAEASDLLVARHVMWLCGVRCLSLEYCMAT